MAIEDDLRGEFTDQEQAIIREHETNGGLPGFSSVLAAQFGVSEASVWDLLYRWAKSDS